MKKLRVKPEGGMIEINYNTQKVLTYNSMCSFDDIERG